MAIPQSQLDTWTHQGATATSSAAYNSIQHALSKTGSPLENRGVEIFLQGSYANATNIYADSDIDVIVLYNNTFHWDPSRLTQAQQALHEQVYPRASYPWTSLKADVLAALRAHYGKGAVTPGNKAISVVTGGGKKPADVVPVVQYRSYTDFTNPHNPYAFWGVQFFDGTNRPIVNYPQYHRTNGEAKNSAERTRGNYKETVRVFKNIRNCLIDRGLLHDGAAPSYFIECLLYNVPDVLFTSSTALRIPAIITYLRSIARTAMTCQNGVLPLFGSTSTQWNDVDCLTFLNAANQLWNNW
ncbi:MAG: nucleotidyltransferase [Acidobacteriota bacterium]